MKFTDNRNQTRQLTFGDLDAGEAFTFISMVKGTEVPHIKGLDDIDHLTQTIYYKAVNLKTGDIFSCLDTAPVHRIKYKFILED